MSVYKRGNIYWYGFTRDGVRYQASTRSTRKADAVVIEAKKKTDLALAPVGIVAPKDRGPIPSFDEAMEQFLKWSAVEHAAKPATTRRYVVSCKSLLRFFGQQELDKIDSGDVERFRDWRRIQTAQSKRTKHTTPKPTGQIMPATVNRELACLKALFTYFVRRKIVNNNPVDGIKMLREEQSFNTLSHDDERAYLAQASPLLAQIAILILETGMRPDEVYGMRRSDLHLEDGYYFNRQGKTPSARRRVPLTTRARQVVTDRLEATTGEFLFPGNVSGRHIVKINAAHTGALLRSGLPKFRLYDMRHTFATRFVESGGDLVTLAQILGHRDLRLVMVYSHPTDPHKQHSIQRFEAYNESNRRNPLVSVNGTGQASFAS